MSRVPHITCHAAGKQFPGTPGHETSVVGQIQAKQGNFPDLAGFRGVSGEDKEWLDGLIGKTVPVANLPSTFDI